MPFEGFLDGHNNIKVSLISDEAENIAKSMKSSGVNKNQIRNFYANFLNIYFSSANEYVKKIQLVMLLAHAEYKSTKSNKEIFNFLSERINFIKIRQKEEFKINFDAFKMHFEAVIAYFPNN